MILTLHLENVPWFEDGRPTSITLREQSCRIGRNASMDWVLPDPDGHISRHHCDVIHDGGTYYLVDRSTNGTFVDGQRHRIQGEHPLRDGDRFRIGQYFIGVALQAAQADRAVRPPLDNAADAAGHSARRLPEPSALPPLAPPPAFAVTPEPLQPLPTENVFADWGGAAPPRMTEDAWSQKSAFASEPLPPDLSDGLQLPPVQGGSIARGGSDPWDEEAEYLDPVDPLPVPNRRAQAFDSAAKEFVPLQQRPRQSQDMSGLQLPPSQTQPAAAPTHAWDEPSIAPALGRQAAPASRQDRPHWPGEPMPPMPTPSQPMPAPSPPWSAGTGNPAAPPTHAPVAAPVPRPSPNDMVPVDEAEDHRLRPSRPPSTARAATPAAEGPAGYGAAIPDTRAFLRAFCEGAGLPPAAFDDVDALDLARALGRSVRISTDELMAMLADREAAKRFTGGVEITSWSPRGNNPMKVLADADQALVALFLRPKNGFMTGPDGFENALKDVHLHQRAVFAALQPALLRVVEGLSPREIEEETANGLLGGPNKSRAWDRFVERWTEKAEAGRNGILDCFLKAFSEAYAQAVGTTRE